MMPVGHHALEGSLMQTRSTRLLLVAALSSSFVVIAPDVPFTASPAQAQNLFETLFPRAAQRRRERREARRRATQRYIEAEKRRLRQARRAQQRRAAASRPVIKKPIFKQYAVRKQSTVALAGLASAFAAYDQKLLAAEALRQEADDRAAAAPVATVIPAASPTGVVPVIAEPEVVAPPAQPEREPIDAVRLSAGSVHLEGMKFTARSGLGKALVAYYKENPELLWLNGDGKPTQAALDVHALLMDADAEGLNAADYAVDLPAAYAEDPLREAMGFEFAMTAAAAQYLADARLGIADPNRVSHYHDFKGLKADYAKLIAKLAGEKLRGYEGELAAIDSERKKKKFYKKVEKELKAEFGDELTKLTISQGRILIKLIDRETGDTSYELVSELRGNFSAFFWQGLARIFGHNLKSNYDPEGEDRMIEEIVQRIESEG